MSGLKNSVLSTFLEKRWRSRETVSKISFHLVLDQQHQLELLLRYVASVDIIPGKAELSIDLCDFHCSLNKELVMHSANFPQQANGHDCGCYVIGNLLLIKGQRHNKSCMYM